MRLNTIARSCGGSPKIAAIGASSSAQVNPLVRPALLRFEHALDQRIQVDRIGRAAPEFGVDGCDAPSPIDQAARDVRGVDRGLHDGSPQGRELGWIGTCAARARISSALLTAALKALMTWCPTAAER